MGQDPSQIREEIEETRSQMGETVDALGHKADIKSRATESIADKRDRMKEKITGAGSSVGDSTPDAQQVKEGARQAVGVAQENPLGLALGSLALGFLAGMAVPSTRVEDEKLGPMADEVKDRAKETGQEALERGKQVAQEAAQSAAQTAKETGQEHAEELKSSAQDSAQEAKQTAQQQSSRS